MYVYAERMCSCDHYARKELMGEHSNERHWIIHIPVCCDHALHTREFEQSVASLVLECVSQTLQCVAPLIGGTGSTKYVYMGHRGMGANKAVSKSGKKTTIST